MASFMLSHFSYVLCPQLLSQGSTVLPTLLVMVTQAQEIATTVEDAHAILMLAIEASVREAIAAWDSATLRVKDAEDRAALVKRESLERV
jgi:hypothetical protein